MKAKIIRIDSIQGLKKAEWYKARGYNVEMYGFSSVRITKEN